MLKELSLMHDELLKTAKSVDSSRADDILQDTYLKLYDSGKKFHEIDKGYIYLTMRSVFLDSVKQKTCKNRIVLVDDFKYLEQIEDEYSEIEIDLKPLNNFEKLLTFSLYGKDIVDSQNKIIERIEGVSMLKLSNETDIPYVTIRATRERIKKKLNGGNR